MAKRTQSSRRSQRTELSPERLELIHRFMSESPEDVSVESARTVRDEPPALAAPPAPVPDLPPVTRPSGAPRGKPPAPSLARGPREAQAIRKPRATGPAAHPAAGRRIHMAAHAMRHHVELVWPVAAAILALLVGVLIARAV